MKYGWRIGANGLKVIGSFGAADSRSNMLNFTGHWYNQLVELMKNGVRVEVEPGDGLVMELVEEEGVRIKLPEDLSQVPGPLCLEAAVEVLEVTSQEVLGGLKVQWVPDHTVDTMIEQEISSVLVTAKPPVILVDQGAEGELNTEQAEGGQELVEEHVEQSQVEVQVENGQLEVQAQLVNVPVDIIYSNDMAFCYEVLGLSGAAGCFPSPFTLVPKEHLHAHATSSSPHNWEQPGCQFPYRDPEQLYQELGGLQQGLQEWRQPGQERSPPLRRQGGPHHPLWRGHQGLPRNLCPLPPAPGARPEWRLPARPYGYRLPDWGQESNRGGA